MLVNAYKKKTRFLLLLPGIIIIVAGIMLNANGLIRGYVLPLIGILILIAGIYYSLTSIGIVFGAPHQHLTGPVDDAKRG